MATKSNGSLKIWSGSGQLDLRESSVSADNFARQGMASAVMEAANERPRVKIKWSAVWWVLSFVFLALLQATIGADPAYVLLVLTFNLMWISTVYVLGGFTTMLGICAGFLGLQHITFSQFVKVYLNQRPDTPLYEPIQTLMVYNIGMFAVMLAALLIQLPPFKMIKPVLPSEMRVERLRSLAITLTVLMVGRYATFLAARQIFRILANFEFLTPMAVAAVTAYYVIKSDKKRFTGLMTWVVLGLPFLAGLAYGQRKEAAYGVMILVITALAFGYRFKFHHYLVGLAGLYFLQFIFFPFALVARGELANKDFGTNIGRAFEIFTDVVADPVKYQEEAKDVPTPQAHYFNRLFYFGYAKPEPTLDRLAILITTDALVQATDQVGHTGWKTLDQGLLMVVPRAFNPDKNPIGSSNWIAQRAPGVVNDDDFITSITMGFFQEGYMAFGWWGLFFVSLSISLLFFGFYSLVASGTLPGNVWSCALFINLPWTFSEGTIQQNLILTLQTGSLFAATGLILIILSNSLARRKNLQAETMADLTPMEGGLMVRRAS